MSCNCKNKAKKMERYSEDTMNGDTKKIKNPFLKILEILLQICFGIFCGIVIIIMIVPMLLYIIGCLITGKEAHFNIRNIFKKKK
jgi:F0F1-type ATP synthase assembly protein I